MHSFYPIKFKFQEVVWGLRVEGYGVYGLRLLGFEFES